MDNYCSDLGKKSKIIIEPKSLLHGYYIYVFTISNTLNMADFRQYIQPIEITRSDLTTIFGGNETLTTTNDELYLDFYLKTIDPDNESDRRKLNFTLICYPERLESSIFVPNIIQLGPSRPTETNPHNMNDWSIQWVNFNLILNRPELNLQFYENRCFSSDIKQDKNKTSIRFDLEKKTLNISERDLIFSNGTLHFLLIVRHLIDGRQLIARLEVDKQSNFVFDTADLNQLESIMDNLDDLASSNPTQAVELVTGLADRLNQMSENNVSIIL